MKTFLNRIHIHIFRYICPRGTVGDQIIVQKHDTFYKGSPSSQQVRSSRGFSCGSCRCWHQRNPRVDGGWSSWGSWSECNSNYDGKKSRKRFCDNPFPENYGSPCDGQEEDLTWTEDGLDLVGYQTEFVSCEQGTTTTTDSCSEGFTYFPHTGKCYGAFFNGRGITRTASHIACISQGGHLASVHDLETNNFLHNLRNGDVSFRAYIGGVYVNGSWSWSDGSPWDFEYWRQGDPSDPHYEIYNEIYQVVDVPGSPPGSWNSEDDVIGYPNGYICQKEASNAGSQSTTERPTTISGGANVPSNEEFCSTNSQHTMCKYPVSPVSFVFDQDSYVFQGPSDDCSSKTVFRELTDAAKQDILDKHNELRRRVARGQEVGQPGAGNMRKLVWNTELETVAQRWADQCNFGHDTNRTMSSGTSVGQNAYWSASTVAESESIQSERGVAATQAW